MVENNNNDLVDCADVVYEIENDLEYLASHLKILCNGSACGLDYVITSEDILCFSSSLYEKVKTTSEKIKKLKEILNQIA